MGGQRQPETVSQSRLEPGQKPYLEDIRSRAQGLANQGNVGISEATQQTIDASLVPVTRQFNESVLPQLTSAAENAGAYGGARFGIVKDTAGRDFMGEAARVALTMGPQLRAQELQQQWMPLANYSQMVGPPTVLTTGTQYVPPDMLEQLGGLLKLQAGGQAGILGGLGGANSLLTGGALRDAFRRWF